MSIEPTSDGLGNRPHKICLPEIGKIEIVFTFAVADPVFDRYTTTAFVRKSGNSPVFVGMAIKNPDDYPHFEIGYSVALKRALNSFLAEDGFAVNRKYLSHLTRKIMLAVLDPKKFEQVLKYDRIVEEKRQKKLQQQRSRLGNKYNDQWSEDDERFW